MAQLDQGEVMTREQLIDTLTEAAIASMCQPPRCTAIIRAIASLAKGERVDVRFPDVVYEQSLDGSRRLAQLDADGTPICPRQHLSQAAEQAVLVEDGPCLCASCTACRARGMS